jgi:hypothetical protein
MGVSTLTLPGMDNPPIFDPSKFEEVEDMVASIGMFYFSNTLKGIIKRNPKKRKVEE